MSEIDLSKELSNQTPAPEIFEPAFLKCNENMLETGDLLQCSNEAIWKAFLIYVNKLKLESGVDEAAEISRMIVKAVKDSIPSTAAKAQRGDPKALDSLSRMHKLFGERDVRVKNYEGEGEGTINFVFLKRDWLHHGGKGLHQPTIDFIEDRQRLSSMKDKHSLCSDGCAMRSAADKCLEGGSVGDKDDDEKQETFTENERKDGV